MIFSLIVSCATDDQIQDLPILVDSLLNQYDSDAKNFEVIFVVDNSLPENITLVEQQVQRLSKFNARMLAQGQAGVSAARNLGILNAKGDWLIFATASDFFDQHFLSELAHAIYLYQGMGMFFTRIQSYNPKHPQQHKYYHDLEGTAPKNTIEVDLDDNMIFDLGAVNNLQRSARRIAFNRKVCLEKNVLFREDVLFGSEKIFHFHYLYALKQLVEAGDPRFHLGFKSVYVKGAVFHTLPPAVRKDLFFSKAKFKSQDLIYAQTGYLVAAYELAQSCEFDVNFIVDNFTLISQSLVYALDFSPSLTTYNAQVRNELIAFVNILKTWMQLIRDAGATIQFLDTVAKDNFFVRVNAQPYALFLQAIACNPSRCDQVIDFLMTKKPDNQEQVSAPATRVYEETNTFKRALQSVANTFLSLFGSKTRKVEVVELSENYDQTPSQELEKSISNEKATYSQINKQLVNNATELAYLYYRKLYYKNKEPYLAIVTNIPNRVLSFLDSLGFNRKNLTRNITYRVCGLNVGRQLMLNLSLLNGAERKALFAFCEKNYKNNSFSYLQHKGLKRWALNFFSDFHVAHKNYIFYRKQQERQTLSYLENISQLLGKTASQASGNEVKLVNSYELGYELEELGNYELSQALKEKYVLPFVHTEAELYNAEEDLYTQLKEKATALAAQAKYDAQGNDLSCQDSVESLNLQVQPHTETSSTSSASTAAKEESTAQAGEQGEKASTAQATQTLESKEVTSDGAEHNQVNSEQGEASESKAELEQTTTSQAQTQETEESAGAETVLSTEGEQSHKLEQMLEQLAPDTGTVATSQVLENLEPETLEENLSAEALTSENTEQATEVVIPTSIHLKDIFAPHRIRGLNLGDYASDYRPLAVEDLGTDPLDHNLGHSLNYYTKFVGLNSLIIPLSEVLDRKNFSMRLLPPRFPLLDIIVVVDTVCTEFNLSSLTSFPNLRLLFTDVTTYKYWLDYIKYYAGTKNEQVNYKLYLHRYDHWRLLTRSFVLIRNKNQDK
ncbi:glycosyltransferase family A protein [Psittacicella gerlachiana]|uniref:Glycosyltransferase 2-like domain-containing protein n=1 Tax=Psittacicella gerlachiana TaxID=2028574 RepID=A0A3A1YLX8_9GAMM|nr:glycosyltransferase family 2 protein [Psittacicella gerlachiana]RIY38561.1 hypothetical protein CKF59_00545 [Psittacicella gerlachiana]